jgi:6-pyruvoyltetrahydropterin/6-carboxytetrahydropterin synthase
MELVVDFEFCAAHRLPRHPGRCFRMHGHSYRLQVMVTGAPDPETGMVVDFFDIERAVGSVVDPIRDTCLNDVLENPTAEAIVVWLWQQIQPCLASLSGLRLYETEACHVTYRGEPVPEGLLKAGVPGRHPSTA